MKRGSLNINNYLRKCYSDGFSRSQTKNYLRRIGFSEQHIRKSIFNFYLKKISLYVIPLVLIFSLLIKPDITGFANYIEYKKDYINITPNSTHENHTNQGKNFSQNQQIPNHQNIIDKNGCMVKGDRVYV